jgi:hypothetical protein
MIFPPLIGLLFAYVVLWSTDKYDTMIKSVTLGDNGWFYASVFLFARAISLVNLYPT